MTDLERTEAAAEPALAHPAFARVQPRWGGVRTEQNLAATLGRIERGRRLQRAGGLSLALAGAAAVALFVGTRSAEPGASVALAPASPAAKASASEAPLPSSGARSPSTVASAAAEMRAADGLHARSVVAEIARVDRKIASARILFKKQVAQRQYAAAYRSLVATPDVADQSAEGLMLAADAARLSGHAAESVPYFRRLLRDHARDARAPVAAFTLGRILLSELERPAEAADAFALARRLAPGGALASDALAREVEAAARAGQRERARTLAEEFLSRYPDGRRASAVRRAGGLE